MYCKAGEDGFHEITAAILNDALFQQCYDTLSESTWELTHFSNTKVDGTVNCNRDGILYTSIPQDGNWFAYVDGTPADIVLIGDAMCGIPLTEGQHNISFRYENKAFSLGWKVSLGALTIFLVAVCIAYIPKKERRDKNDRTVTENSP